MSGQVTITQLPTASALTGSELVPVVQNGVTAQTTTSAIAGAGALNYPFLTVGSTAGLTQARYLATGTGLSLADNGAGSTLQINLTGIYPSLNTVGNGFVVKNGSSTLINRTLTVGSGMTISDGDGISANPLIGLSQLLQNISSTTSVGLLTVNGTTVTGTTIIGTTNQISIANGNGVTGSPTVSIYPNPVLPGTGSVVLPSGTTAQRSGTNGALRYNTDTASLEAYANSAWGAIVSGSGVTTFSAGTTGFTPNTPTAGGIVLAGILNPANGGTGINNGSSTITIGGNFAVSGAYPLTLTVSGTTSLSLPASGTLATLAGTETLTNKSISGSTNTLTNIPNSALTNNSITIGTTTVALGGTTLTPAGLTSVTVTQDPTTALQLATKQYVDSVAQGLNTKAPVLCATTTNITLSGEQTIDGVTTSASRVLVKNQSTASQNGIYLSGSGAWTRTTDANTWNQLISAYVFVETGSTQADTGWVCTVDPGGTLGVTAVTWVQFSGAGTYSAGTGLTLAGTQFSLTSPVTTALGGTGITTAPTAGAIVYGATTSTLGYTAIGTTGKPLLSAGAGTPTFGTLSVGGGGTGLTAGTSGGVPYFSSTSAISSSALLTLNALMVGGGAGSAPSTVTTGTGVVTALGVNTGTAGAFVVNGGALGTPSSGTVTNLTGTASININGTVGATTPTTGAFTTITASGVITSTLATGTAPFTVASTTTVANLGATNTVNTGITAVTSGATNYLTFVTATSGNLPQLVNSFITANAVNGTITGGIAGGAF